MVYKIISSFLIGGFSNERIKSEYTKKVEPYTVVVNGMKFLDKKHVEEAQNEILTSYSNVYVWIEESDIGRDKFMVGNAMKRVNKPIFEMYIEG